jgi:steroid 5-alpha reductase family enzyme
MTVMHAMAVAAAAIAALMVTTWIASLIARDASLVDRVWGLGFVVVAGAVRLADSVPVTTVELLLVASVTIWGLRLSGYLWWRNSKTGEDYRYVAMRKKYGSKFGLISLVTVFATQGVLMWIVSLPLQFGQVGNAQRWPIAAVGLALWIIGFGFEAIGDAQLAAFKADPANQGATMNKGLWAWTRHPNYFGDATLWWGIGLISAATFTKWWWLVALIGPAVMNVLVRRVSGVTLLEHSLRKRRPGYEEYVRTTSPFIPMPPGTYRQRRNNT